MAIIEISNLSVVRNKKTILKDISFSINKKDFITIIGPNGGGKSMLLKAILNIYKPDKGFIKKDKSLKIGYMPQRLHINRYMPIKVLDFILLHKKDTKNIDEIINKVDICHLLDSNLYSVSGGELQRVLLARALVGYPDILLLDEPAQNLDIKGQLNFYALIEDIYNKQNIAILMISHDLFLVMKCTKKVICISKTIHCSGAPDDIQETQKSDLFFGGDIPKMMAMYKHDLW